MTGTSGSETERILPGNVVRYPQAAAIRSKLEHGNVAEPTLWVVPTARRAERLQSAVWHREQAAVDHGTPSLPAVRPMAFADLKRALAAVAEETIGLAPLSARELAPLVQHVLRTHKDYTNLETLAGLSRDAIVESPGYLRRITDAVLRALQAPIMDDNTPLSRPAFEIQRLAGVVAQHMETLGTTIESRLFQRLAEAAAAQADTARANIRAALHGIQRVVFDGFTNEDIAREHELIAAALEAAGVHVFWLLDSAPICSAKPAEQWIVAQDRIAEADAIAASIRADIDARVRAGEHPRCTDYAVIMPSLDLAEAPLARAFSNHGIPCNIATGKALRETTLFRAVEKIFALADPTLSYAAAEGLLQLGAHVRGSNHATLLETLWALKIERSFERTCDGAARAAYGARRLARNISPQNNAEPGDDELSALEGTDDETTTTSGNEWTRRIAAQSPAAFQSLANYFRECARAAATMAQPHAPAAWGTVLEGILHTLSLDVLPARQGRFTLGEHAHRVRAIATLREAYAAIAKLATVLQQNDMSWSEFAPLLRVEAEARRVPQELAHEAGVLIAGRRDAFDERPRMLVVGGLVEGEFPAVKSAAFLIAPEFGSEFPSEDEQLRREEELFHRLRTLPSQRVVFTRPASEGAEHLQASRFWCDPAPAESAAPATDAPPREEHAITVGTQAGARVPDLLRKVLDQSISTDAHHANPSTRAAWNVLANHDAIRYGDVVTPLDGWLDDTETARDMREANARNIYSASSLDKLIQCRYRFTAERALDLDDEREADDEAAAFALKYGSVVHTILEQHLAKIFDAKSKGLPAAGWPTTSDTVDEVLAQEQVAGRLTRSLARLFRFRLLGASADTASALPWAPKGLMKAWSESEPLLVGNYLPDELLLEQPFGRSRAANAGESVAQSAVMLSLGEGQEIEVSGRMDRVDVMDGCGLLTDYKTGAAPSQTDQKAGLSVQMSLYALAYEAAGLRGTCIGGRFVKLTSRDSTLTGVLSLAPPDRGADMLAGKKVLKPEAFQLALANAKQQIADAIGDLHSGYLRTRIVSSPNPCKYCKVIALCRRDDDTHRSSRRLASSDS